MIDLSLPDAGATKVIARLRADAPELKIVATGLSDFDGYRASAVASGADEFVAKPMLYSQLLPALQRMLKDPVGRPTGGTR
jgi:CheY-like chemotaxis protein